MQVTGVPLTNAEAAKIQSLKTKKGRKECGLFLAEGVRLLEEARRWNDRAAGIYVHYASLNDRARALAQEFVSEGTKVYQLNSRQLALLSDTEEPQGIIGAFPIQWREATTEWLGSRKRIVILDGVSDPGNAGAILRSALAFGFDTAFFTGKSADPYNPKVVRSAAGAIFGLQLSDVSLEHIRAAKQAIHLRIIATDIHGVDERRWRFAPLSEKGRAQQVAVVVGSEAHGVSPDILSIADERIAISQSSKVESLNAAVAAAIVMHHIFLVDTAARSAVGD